MDKSQAACNNPATTFLFMDRGADMCFTAWYDWKGRSQNSGNSGRFGPHFEGKNIGFVDGHVKFFRSDRIVARDLQPASGINPDPSSPNYAYFQN